MSILKYKILQVTTGLYFSTWSYDKFSSKDPQTSKTNFGWAYVARFDEIGKMFNLDELRRTLKHGIDFNPVALCELKATTKIVAYKYLATPTNLKIEDMIVKLEKDLIIQRLKE